MASETAEKAKKFDLIAALEGRNYPEETVTLILDDSILYRITKTDEMIDDPAFDGDKDELEKVRAQLIEAAKDMTVKAKVRGIPIHIYNSILKSVRADFPEKVDAFGRAKFEEAADEALAERLWIQQVVEITAPDGETYHPSPEELKALRDMAPDASIRAVSKAMHDLREGANSGYEATVQDPDFLSQR